LKRYIVVYDICSSTQILDNLLANEIIDKYDILITDISKSFTSLFSKLNPIFYKFLGDGSIFFFKEETDVDSIINLLCDFIEESDFIINNFVKRYIDIDLKRVGITIGVAFVNIYLAKIKNEYFGRAINMACRLQNSLNKPEHVNKILVQKEVFKSINDKELRRWFNIRRRTFSNLNADQLTQCYEMDPYNEDLERNQT
jgi:class 3 adenylate cyclase